MSLHLWEHLDAQESRGRIAVFFFFFFFSSFFLGICSICCTCPAFGQYFGPGRVQFWRSLLAILGDTVGCDSVMNGKELLGQQPLGPGPMCEDALC